MEAFEEFWLHCPFLLKRHLEGHLHDLASFIRRRDDYLRNESIGLIEHHVEIYRDTLDGDQWQKMTDFVKMLRQADSARSIQELAKLVQRKVISSTAVAMPQGSEVTSNASNISELTSSLVSPRDVADFGDQGERL